MFPHHILFIKTYCDLPSPGAKPQSTIEEPRPEDVYYATAYIVCSINTQFHYINYTK